VAKTDFHIQIIDLNRVAEKFKYGPMGNHYRILMSGWSKFKQGRPTLLEIRVLLQGFFTNTYNKPLP
jgi:hypothetical protein